MRDFGQTVSLEFLAITFSQLGGHKNACASFVLSFSVTFLQKDDLRPPPPPPPSKEKTKKQRASFIPRPGLVDEI